MSISERLDVPAVAIATVRRTGKRYIVQTFNHFTRKVLCHGEVLGVSGLSCRHGPDKRFPSAEVDVMCVDRTPELLEELRMQGKKEVLQTVLEGYTKARGG